MNSSCTIGTTHWHVHRGRHWGHVPLPQGAYSVTQNSVKNAPKRVILTLKIQKNFWGGAQSPHTLSPRGGDTPHYTQPFKCPHYN